MVQRQKRTGKALARRARGRQARSLRRTAKTLARRVAQALPPKPKKGQFWQSRDPRVRAVFTVIDISRAAGQARVENVKTGRQQWIRLDRFHRYDYLPDGPKPVRKQRAARKPVEKPVETKQRAPRRPRRVVVPEPEPALVGAGEDESYTPPLFDAEPPEPGPQEEEEPEPDEAEIPEYDPSLDPTEDE